MTIYSYDEALGYKLEICHRNFVQNGIIYYTFNSFEQRDGIAQPINVQDMHLNINSTMSNIDFIIEDSAKTVDRTKVGVGNLVILRYGKHTDYLSDPDSCVFMGYIDYPTPMRPDTNMNEIRVQCFEIKKGLYDTMMNFERSSPLGEITDPSSQNSSDHSLRAHIRSLLEKSKWTILDDISIEDRFNLTKDISHNLSIVIPNVVYNYTSAGDILDDLCNKVGAVWYIDYKDAVPTVKADYPVNLRKPIVIKNGPKPVPMTDDPKKTGYIVGPFNVPSTSAAASGHATRLFGLTKIDRHVVASSETVTHSTSLTNKAIYQPFTTNEIRFNGLDFTCSKKGEPSSPKNRLNGAIYINKVVNNVNMPDVKLMEWHVPLDQIKSSKTVVHVELDDIRTRFIDENVIFGIGWGQRSGIDEGDPNTDEANTILLYRDNSTGASAASSYHYEPNQTFNGTSDIVTEVDAPSLDLVNFSISLWFKTSKDYSSGRGFMLVKGNQDTETAGQNMNYFVRFGTGNDIVAGFENSAGTDRTVVSPLTYNDGKWHHCVVTYDQDTIDLYIDGTRVIQTSTADTPDTNTKDLCIGAHEGPTMFFQGSIDEVRVWNTLIVPDEVSALFASGTVPKSANIVYQNTFGGSGSGSLISSIAAKGDLDSKLTWKAHGPTYNYSITSALNRVFAVTNYTAAEKVGFIEPQPIDLNVIDDANLALRYLGNVLYFASLYKGEPQFTITHPDDFTFKPYQTIRFSDLLSYPAGLDFEVQEIDILFADNTNEINIGGIVYVDDAWPTNWPCAQII